MKFKILGARFSIVTIGMLAVIQQPSDKNDPLIPKDVVQNLLQPYSEKEKLLVARDLANIRELYFDDKKAVQDNEQFYIATAGGPGACKSTVLETFIEGKPNFVYADPDPRSLKFMINTYYQSITYYNIGKNASYHDFLLSAYDKWRNASNYIANTILNEAYAKGYNIAHGTTLTGPVIASLLNKIKKKNYKIILLLCYASDETRIKAINHRAETQAFVQASAEDVINKGKISPQRFPVYFEYADEILFYWTDDFLKGSVLSATFKKNEGLTVNDQEAYKKFVAKYDNVRKKFGGRSIGDREYTYINKV